MDRQEGNEEITEVEQIFLAVYYGGMLVLIVGIWYCVLVLGMQA